MTQPDGDDDSIFGFFSFTEVTAPDQHRAYNEWHQLDHLPQQFSLPFVVFGQRWVSTPACATARAVNIAPFDAVHYVTLYLMRGDPDLLLDDFAELGQQLRVADRFHQFRHSHLSGPFDVTMRASAPQVSISADVLPFRPNRGIYVSLSAPRADQSSSAHAADLDEVLKTPGVAGAWAFQSRPQTAGSRWNPGLWQVMVAFLDEDPVTTADQLNRYSYLTQSDLVALAGPFESIQPWQWEWFD